MPIGDIVSPPFVRLPAPPTLFAGRAGRLRALAEGHRLAPYLRFLADLAEAQHHARNDLAEPVMPALEARQRAREFGLPPLDRNRFVIEPVFDLTLDRLGSLAAAIEMPAGARAALDRIEAADAARRDAMVRAVLADAIPVEALAEHVFVAAALQVHFGRLAARLAADLLVPVGDGACPACGGPPAASLLVGWPDAHGARFCSCALCGTLWNTVRVKCVLCGSTKGIAYHAVDGGPGSSRRRPARRAGAMSRSSTSKKIRTSIRSPTTLPRSTSTCWSERPGSPRRRQSVPARLLKAAGR